MLVCHCSGVSDDQIRSAVRAGAGSRAEVARACASAGEGCGSCVRAIDSLIAQESIPAEAAEDAEALPGAVLLAAG